MAAADDFATYVKSLDARLGAVEKRAMINSTAIAGMTNNSGPGGSGPPPGTRSLIFPHARFREIIRSPSRDNATDRAWYNAHLSDIEDTSANGNNIGHPNAITVQSYLLLTRMEVDGGAVFTPSGGGGTWSAAGDDRSNPGGSCDFYSADYATANGLNVEDFWLHASTGQQNYLSFIWSISATGVLLFNSPSRVGLSTSFPYAVGQSITVAGLAGGIGNGTYTIASLQAHGVTLTGWSAGKLGPTANPSNSDSASIGTFSVPGDGTKTKPNRRWTFYFTEWRNQSNFGNVGCRQMHSARVAFCISGRSDPTKAFNTPFFDEVDSNSCNTTIVNSVEYGPTGGATFGSLTVCAFVTDMSQCLTDMKAYPGGPKFIRVNTSTLTSANDIAFARAAGGIHGEQLLGRFGYDTTGLSYFIARVNEGVDVEFVDGGVWKTAAQNGGVTPVPGIWYDYGIPGNYLNLSQKGQMSSYIYYLLGVDATKTNPDGTTYKHAIFDLCNSAPGDIPASSRWALGYEYNIGQPTGPKTQSPLSPSSAVLKDPAGLSTQTHQRNFSLDGGATLSAWIGYVSVVNGQKNYDATSQMVMSPPAAPTGKAWHILNWDGTLGASSVTAVTLARSEGIILVAL